MLIILLRPGCRLESFFLLKFQWNSHWLLVCTDWSPAVSTYVIILLNILFSPRWFVQQKYQPLSLQCWLACTFPCYFLLCLIKIYVTTSVELLPFQYTQQACNSRERIILLCIMKSIKKVVQVKKYYLAQILLYTTKKSVYFCKLHFVLSSGSKQ